MSKHRDLIPARLEIKVMSAGIDPNQSVDFDLVF
jgi:hypothetical protein